MRWHGLVSGRRDNFMRRIRLRYFDVLDLMHERLELRFSGLLQVWALRSEVDERRQLHRRESVCRWELRGQRVL